MVASVDPIAPYMAQRYLNVGLYWAARTCIKISIGDASEVGLSDLDLIFVPRRCDENSNKR